MPYEIYIGVGVIGGTFLSWVLGVFNPLGMLGVRPWRVPRCERCGRMKSPLHKSETGCAG